MNNETEFIEQDIFEFVVNENIKIFFDLSTNSFYSENEEEDFILIEDNTSKLDNDIELFDGYILTLEKFNEIKSKIEEIKNDYQN